MTLTVSRLYNIDDRTINECGAVCVIFDTINGFFISFASFVYCQYRSNLIAVEEGLLYSLKIS